LIRTGLVHPRATCEPIGAESRRHEITKADAHPASVYVSLHTGDDDSDGKIRNSRSREKLSIRPPIPAPVLVVMAFGRVPELVGIKQIRRVSPKGQLPLALNRAAFMRRRDTGWTAGRDAARRDPAVTF
jgi:hypothetical protein